MNRIQYEKINVNLLAIEPAGINNYEYLATVYRYATPELLDEKLTGLSKTPFNSLEQYAYTTQDYDLSKLHAEDDILDLAIMVYKEVELNEDKVSILIMQDVIAFIDYDTAALLFPNNNNLLIPHLSGYSQLTTLRNRAISSAKLKPSRLILSLINLIRPSEDVKYLTDKTLVFLKYMGQSMPFESTLGTYGRIYTQSCYLLEGHVDAEQGLRDLLAVILEHAETINGIEDRIKFLTQMHRELAYHLPFKLIKQYKETKDLIASEIYRLSQQ